MGKFYAGGKLRSSDTIAILGQRTLSGANPEMLWTGTNIQRPTPSSEQLRVVSDSAQDGAAGTGCLTLRIDYLDGDGVRQSETVTMDGLTPVTTTATDVTAILAVTCMTFGSGNAADGTITVTNTGATSTFEQVESMGSQSLAAVYKVPAGNQLQVTSIWASASAASQVWLYSDTNPATGAVVSGAQYVWGLFSAVTTHAKHQSMVPAGPFPAGASVWMAAQDAAATLVVGTIEGYLEAV